MIDAVAKKRHFVFDGRTATPHFPGIGRYVTNLARALIPQLEEDERLTLLYHPKHPPVLPSSDAVQALPVGASVFSPRQQWHIPRLLGRAGAELYHSAYYLMPYRPGVPAVLTVYDLIPLLFPQQSSRRARLMFRWTIRLALRATHYCLAISEATRQDLVRHFHVAPDRIACVPLAADPAFTPQDVTRVERVRNDYGLPDRYVLYLGSNKPHKNLVGLVDAWSELQPRSEVLVIAGAWDERYPEPRRRVVKLGLEDRVRLLGPVPEEDLPALYSGAEVFAFPSMYEGFGLPVLEAMACGTPVVCSDRSSLPEVAGDAAVYCDPTQTGSIADALQRVLRNADLRQDLHKRGLARASQFSWERTARETLEVYREIAR